MPVDIGFVDGLKGYPSILLIGDAQSLCQLCVDLRRLTSQSAHVIHIEDLDIVQSHGSFTLTAALVSTRNVSGLRSDDDREGRHFIWRLDAERWLEVVEKIEGVARGIGPGHQYLGIELVEDAEIVVSKGEYDVSVYNTTE